MSGATTTTTTARKTLDQDGFDVPQPKRQRVELEEASDEIDAATPAHEAAANIAQGLIQNEDQNAMESLAPPSRALLGDFLTDMSATGHTQEFDVGISEYVSKDLLPIHAIIKQRQAFLFSLIVGVTLTQAC